jgi:integrase
MRATCRPTPPPASASRATGRPTARRGEGLVPDELAALIAAVDPRWRDLIELLAYTGLRIKEALALRWSDLSLGSARAVTVRRALETGHTARYGPPKSRAGRRTVPIPVTVAMQLRLRRAEGEWCDDDSLVFLSSRGTPMLDSNLRHRVLRPAARAAGVGWMGFHTLRHTFASLLFGQAGTSARCRRCWATVTRASRSAPTSTCSPRTRRGDRPRRRLRQRPAAGAHRDGGVSKPRTDLVQSR